MEGRNCPNCGAVIDKDVDKCAYCGTSYFDLTAINFDSVEPVFLKFKIKGCTLTGKFRPCCGGITLEEDLVSAYVGASHLSSTRLETFTRGRNVSLGISLESVPDQNGDLFRVTVNGDK